MPEAPWKMKPDPGPKRDSRPNLTGSLPLFFGGLVVYPSAADNPFVAMTPPYAKDKNTIQVYDYTQMKPVGAPIHGRLDVFMTKYALSPDGKYFGTVLPDVPRATVDVYSTADGGLLRRIEVDADPEMKVGTFDFVADDHLLTAKYRGAHPLWEAHTDYEVWDLKTGKRTAAFAFDLVWDWRWVTISPGRNYFVLQQTDNDRGYHICGWDLTTGASVGEFAFQGRKDPWGQARGLAFTPDGERLAMLWRLAESKERWARLFCWDVRTGKKLFERTIPRDGSYIDTLSVRGGPFTLQWLPDPKDGWLLFDHLIVDAETGVTVAKVGSPPFGPYDPEPRRFVDRDHMTAIEPVPERGAFATDLVVKALPRARIDAAVKQARAGPPPKPIDPYTVAWSVQLDPLPQPDDRPRLDGTIPMPSAGDLAFFPEDADCRYVALTAPGAQDKNVLQVYDLRQMKAVGAPAAGKFDGLQPVRVSPDGAYLATPVAGTRTPTVEVFSVATGRSLRRLDVDQNPQVKVAFFDFAGQDRLLTVKQGGSLEQQNVFQVWDLKTGEPVAEFVWEGFFTDKFCTFSPGRKYLVLAASNIITGHYMLAWDLTTGKPAGMFEFQDKKAEGGQIAGLYFSPDATKLAMFWIASNGVGSVPHIRCWDARTGKPLLDHALPQVHRGAAALWTAGGLRNIQWLPDGSGWLVFSHFVIDYETGAVVGRLGREPAETGQILPRYFADRDHATTAVEDNLGLPKALTVMALPREQIDAEVKKARGDRAPPR